MFVDRYECKFFYYPHHHQINVVNLSPWYSPVFLYRDKLDKGHVWNATNLRSFTSTEKVFDVHKEWEWILSLHIWWMTHYAPSIGLDRRNINFALEPCWWWSTLISIGQYQHGLKLQTKCFFSFHTHIRSRLYPNNTH